MGAPARITRMACSVDSRGGGAGLSDTAASRVRVLYVSGEGWWPRRAIVFVQMAPRARFGDEASCYGPSGRREAAAVQKGQRRKKP